MTNILFDRTLPLSVLKPSRFVYAVILTLRYIYQICKWYNQSFKNPWTMLTMIWYSISLLEFMSIKEHPERMRLVRASFIKISLGATHCVSLARNYMKIIRVSSPHDILVANAVAGNSNVDMIWSAFRASSVKTHRLSAIVLVVIHNSLPSKSGRYPDARNPKLGWHYGAKWPHSRIVCATCHFADTTAILTWQMRTRSWANRPKREREREMVLSISTSTTARDPRISRAGPPNFPTN